MWQIPKFHPQRLLQNDFKHLTLASLLFFEFAIFDHFGEWDRLELESACCHPQYSYSHYILVKPTKLQIKEEKRSHSQIKKLAYCSVEN